MPNLGKNSSFGINSAGSLLNTDVLQLRLPSSWITGAHHNSCLHLIANRHTEQTIY